MLDTTNGVIPVWNPGKRMVSSQCPNTGIQFSLQIHQKCFIL
ncbi:hypothetical protein [Wolbachia endosymbiont (group A) of Scambus nigricans]|nr:hypothetical protein [Wolbachia endosymbiont (group A) of Scambus nigricans]